MKKIILIIIILGCFTHGFVLAQGRVVSGAVSDDKGPIEGATVLEKGFSSNGASTDAGGKFTLALKGNGNTIVITNSGYLSQEVKAVSGLNNITLSLDPKVLNEVIVVGYGKQKKLTLTGAASQIAGPELRRNPSASLQNGLTGRLPGLYSQQRSGRPGNDGAAFFIRGVSSFTGANEPLIIVDDIEYSYAQFAALDANEVETITILKDASTTAIYGIKGANGVVVVTTRRGKGGPPKISLRSEYASMKPTILPDYLDAYQSASLFNQARLNDGVTTPYFSNTDLELFQNGQDPIGHPNIDWEKVLFRKYSHQTRNNLDITGGTDRVKYFVSLGYIKQGGMLNDFSQDAQINNNYDNQRFNYRSNLDIKATKDLDIRVDFYGNRGQVTTPNIQYSGKGKGNINGDKNDAFYEFGSFLSLAPFAYPIKNPDGSWGYSDRQRTSLGISGGSYDANNIIGRLSLFGYRRNYTDNMSLVTSANQKLNFITNGLSAKVLISYSGNYNYNRDVTRSEFPSYIYDPVNNTYTPRDLNIYTVAKFGQTYTTNATYREVNLQGSLNYDHNFANHHLYGLALISRNSKTTSNASADYNFVPVNFQGTTVRLGYDYKQKYLLQFNGAYNGTDRFEASKRFGLFPAVSAGWNIAEEGFFKKAVPVVNLFKIRGSYGIVGSDRIGSSFSYAYRQTYFSNTSGPDVFGYFPANNRIITTNFGTSSSTIVATNLQEGTLSNLDVTWEKEKKLDLGVDFGLFNNKVTGTVDYFNNDRYDILTTRGTVTQIFGQSLPPVNLGKTNNRGFEIELTYRDKIGKDFSFSVKGNYSLAKNKVVFRDEPSGQIPAYQLFTGQSIGQSLIYKWTGGFYKDSTDIAKSPTSFVAVRPGDLKYADINGDNKIDNNDRGFFGLPNLPNTNYGFQLGARYKNIDFSILFQGAANFSVNAYSEAIRPFSANLQEVHTKSWTPALGDNAEFPILTVSKSGISDPSVYGSTFWSRSGNYLRLKNAQLSYSFPKALLDRMRVSDIQVYVNGNNLATWSKLFKLYGLDPEFDPGTNSGDRVAYPPQRTYNVGLNVTF
ncbi:MAG: TonB-dependent receptor [Ferruginibacter sp.]|nr:TonB-dependent receptor [Ferruginibacter sp.]